MQIKTRQTLPFLEVSNTSLGSKFAEHDRATQSVAAPSTNSMHSGATPFTP